jgi:hypothetical protein
LLPARSYQVIFKEIKNPAGYTGFLDCLAYLKVTFDYLRRASTD